MASVDRFEMSSAPVRRVKAVQFSVLSPELLRSYSVAKIDSPETFVSGKPKEGGLSDPRLGTMDRNIKCQTDGCGIQDSPGYFGHIELAKPMYHIGFMKIVLKVLRCVGYHSSKLLIDKKEDEKYKVGLRIKDPSYRLRYFSNICGSRDVDIFSGGPQPKYRLVGTKIHLDFKKAKQEELGENERKQELSAEMAHQILKKVPDEDYEALGFDVKNSRPDWFILTVLPVPPPPVRPAVMMDSSARCEDDLTHKLAEIIRSNNDLKRQEQNGAPQHIINEFCELLQFHITTYFDNTLPGVPRSNQRSGRPIKSISQRLKGKDGRIRGNLMGKRVDFSARTVISGDANIGIDEVGVPWSIATNMTYPETVTPFNYDILKKAVANGPHPPPGECGAKYVIRDDGRRLDLRYTSKESDTHLELGYKVERHMRDGDVVLFNRQPSLHKMSMMGHRVKILPYSTFRLNLSVTSPYNADFDGDEMNMHLPQTEETRAETLELMMVPKMIVSPQANKPVIGIVQDALLGARLMTQRDTFIHRELFMNILCHLEDWNGSIPLPAILKAPKKSPLWAGKQVFSMIMPDINARRESGWYNKRGEVEDVSPEDTQVVIQGGQLLTGTLCKKTLGPTAGGLVHIIWMEQGPEETRKFLNNVQYAVNHWLLHCGFSIGIGDTISDEATNLTINELIEKAKMEVRDLIEKFQNGKLDLLPGHTVMGSFEHRVNEVLNRARDDAGKKAQESLKYSNNVVKMVQAGSKGSFINISQMTACVGQQNVEGKRIPYGFQQRTLPHFVKDDFGPESRGFVGNSYCKGLTPVEFFFHAMGGREGLIDTAVKTSSTGYIQRRLVKAMEDLMIKYDGTVRNSAGEIIQFLYGEDGMDGASIEVQKLEHYGMDKKQFERVYVIDIDQERCPAYMDPAIWRDAKKSNLRLLLNQERDRLLQDLKILRKRVLTDGDCRIHLPVHIKRLVWNAQRMFSINTRGPPPALKPSHVIQTIAGMDDKIAGTTAEEPPFTESQRDAVFLFMCHVRGLLASKRVLREFKLTEEAFDWVVGEIITKFHSSKAHPGECIGTIAAQSVGEPTTQMTLNTFHYAGVSAKNVTLGVPRLTEIINVAKTIKTPSLSVYLLKDARFDKEAAKAVQCQLEFTKLKNVAQVAEIWYDPDIYSTVVPEDTEWLADYYILGDTEGLDVANISLWVLRIVLNKEMMLDKNLTMEIIAGKMDSLYGGFLYLIHTDDNADELVLRIRLICDEEDSKNQDYSQDTDFNEALRRLEILLMDMELQGVPDIHRVFIRAEKSKVFNEEDWTFKEQEEYLLDTEGVNLREVMCQNGVDFTRTVSNHLLEVLEVLGIEAVRAALLKELRGVIEFDGSYVNYRHLAILCDMMTFRGNVMAITRHGINRTEKSPWAQCSFEETVEILLRAATYAEKDPMKGVSENIMLGQLCPLGTGCFDLLLDDEMLLEATEPEKIGYHVADLSTATTSWISQMVSPRHAPFTPGPGHVEDGLMMTSPINEAGGFSPEPVMSPPFSPTSNYLTSPPWSPLNPQSPSQMLASVHSRGSVPRIPGSPEIYPMSPRSPGSMAYNPLSPGLSPTSPAAHHGVYSPTSPIYSPHNSQMSIGASFLASSPSNTSPSSPMYTYRGPRYSPTSPSVSPTSPNYSPTSPGYSPAANMSISPRTGYTPTSPGTSTGSPSYSPNLSRDGRSPGYSPSSPSFAPSSRQGHTSSSPVYTPPGSKPIGSDYSPPTTGRVTSPGYTPQMTGRERASPGYSPTSPGYNPSSPTQTDTVQRSPQYSIQDRDKEKEAKNYSPGSPSMDQDVDPSS